MLCNELAGGLGGGLGTLCNELAGGLGGGLGTLCNELAGGLGGGLGILCGSGGFGLDGIGGNGAFLPGALRGLYFFKSLALKFDNGKGAMEDAGGDGGGE